MVVSTSLTGNSGVTHSTHIEIIIIKRTPTYPGKPLHVEIHVHRHTHSAPTPHPCGNKREYLGSSTALRLQQNILNTVTFAKPRVKTKKWHKSIKRECVCAFSKGHVRCNTLRQSTTREEEILHPGLKQD